MARVMLLLPLLVLAGCTREGPVTVERQDLGIRVTFPGKPGFRTYEEDTPVGRLEWWGHHYAGQRMDESFHTEVANVPAGGKGKTVSEVLGSMEGWLAKRLGGLQREALGADRGPGFRYRAKGPFGYTNHVIAGLVIVRKGRIYHAQATVQNGADPRLAVFLDGFRVLP